MDLTKLNNEYAQYWKSHDFNKALNTLSKLRGYFPGYTLYSDDQILQPYYLLISYAGRNNLQVSQIDTNKITYQFLLNDFADWWNIQVKSIQDLKEKLAAQNQADVFTQLIGAAGKFLNFASSPVIWIVLGVFAMGYVLKKK